MSLDKEKITPEVLKEVHQIMSSPTSNQVRQHFLSIAKAMGYELQGELTDGQLMQLQEHMNETLLNMCEDCAKQAK